MPWAMTSFEVKLSVVPGWKWSGQMMADCFELSPGIAIVVCLSCLLGFDGDWPFDVLELSSWAGGSDDLVEGK
jgi:hypothetical protein